MRHPRTWIYMIVALAIAVLALNAPGAWATPGQSPNNQTVPTVTPTRTFAPPTPIVTLPPRPTATPLPQPGPSPQPAASPQPGVSPQPAASPQPGSTPVQAGAAAGGALLLTVVVDPPLARPGARLQFTATLANVGSGPLYQVVLDEYLAEGLYPEPGGSRYVWDGRHLSVPFGSLASGQQVVLPFIITVAGDAKPGVVLQVNSVATAGVVAPAFVQTLVPLPPAELPPTGGNLRPGGRRD